MPAMEHLGTMLPMEVQRGTTPHMEVVLKPTTPLMVVAAPKLTMLTMVEARIQLPLLRHTEHQLQHQAIIKRGSVLMSGDLKKHTSGHEYYILSNSYVKPVDFVPGDVCCSTKVKENHHCSIILSSIFQVIEPKCTETKKTVKRFVTETVSHIALILAQSFTFDVP